MASPRPLSLGVVGGGAGSFVGPIHRRAAVLDRRFDIVAGVLSSNPDKARAQGIGLGLAPDRAYASLAQMIQNESHRADGIEAVAVMTPNDAHYRDCIAALEAGLHVVCDKPMVNTLEQAQHLAETVRRTGRQFCLTHNYSGYPMVRQARALVASGQLGALRIVQVEYFQSGLARRVEDGTLTARQQWKLDTDRSGPSLVLGDIGSHAHHLACFVAGGRVTQVLADLGAVVPGRQVDDYGAVLWRFDHGARGACMVSQAATGAENNLTLKIYGENGMLEWQHANPNYLRYAPLTGPVQTMGRGDPWLDGESLAASRLTRGHPEGFVEAFANLYQEFADAILADRAGTPLAHPVFPGVHDGLAGVRFIDAAVRSSRAGGAWTPCEP